MQTPADDAVPTRLRSLPSWLLTQTAMHAHRLVAEGLAQVEARGHHYRLLAALEEFGPTSQASLGRRSGVHFSDIVAAVNELAEREFVRRSPDPADRRRNVVTITPAGRRQLRRLDRRLARVQDDLVAPLSTEERDELVRLLSRLLARHAPHGTDATGTDATGTEAGGTEAGRAEGSGAKTSGTDAGGAKTGGAKTSGTDAGGAKTSRAKTSRAAPPVRVMPEARA